MKARAAAVWHALAALGLQLLLALDQVGNVLLCGLAAVTLAALTGVRQNVAFADETMSAHAWRAYERGRIRGRLLMPPIDLLFAWQKPDEEVNALAERLITRHCERAFWKEVARRSLPPAYREASKNRTQPTP